jgi:hypothetical protein
VKKLVEDLDLDLPADDVHAVIAGPRSSSTPSPSTDIHRGVRLQIADAAGDTSRSQFNRMPQKTGAQRVAGA